MTIRRLLMLAVVLLFTGPARADINGVYDMVVHKDGKESTSTMQYSLSADNAVMVMGGEKKMRMVFDRGKSLMRLIDDSQKKYFDLDEATLDELGSVISGAMAQMQKSLEAMPPEQRAMAEKMLKKTLGAGDAPKPPTFVKASGTKTISGYACARYDMMQDGVKKSELWTSTDAKLKPAPAEIETIQAMQNHLAKLLDAVGSLAAHVTEAGAGALRYDGTVEGFPVRTTVYDGDKVASEITLRKVDHEPVDPALLTVPDDYQPQEIKLPPQPGR